MDQPIFAIFTQYPMGIFHTPYSFNSLDEATRWLRGIRNNPERREFSHWIQQLGSDIRILIS